jgi:hypothetical protein
MAGGGTGLGTWGGRLESAMKQQAIMIMRISLNHFLLWFNLIFEI